MTLKIAVWAGEGIGVETVPATLRVLRGIGVPFEAIPVNLSLNEAGEPSQQAERVLVECDALLKGPSDWDLDLNAYFWRRFNAFAGKRVFRAFGHFGAVRRSLDVTLIQDLAELRDVPGQADGAVAVAARRRVAQSECATLSHYALEVAQRKGARRVTCAHSLSRMPVSDGLLRDALYREASAFAQLRVDDVPVERLLSDLVSHLEQYDVLLVPGHAAEGVAAVCAALVGGRLHIPAAIIGERLCVFQASHGAAPDKAGTGAANPTGLLLAASVMLRNFTWVDHARRLEHGVKKAVEAFSRPVDLGRPPRAFDTDRFVEHVLRESRFADGATWPSLGGSRASGRPFYVGVETQPPPEPGAVG